MLSNLPLSHARRKAFVSLAVAGNLALTGCNSSLPSSGGPSPSSTETVSREASGSSERIRVCVQNNTAQNLEYYFDESTVDTQQEDVQIRWGTMGPSAFACGASNNSWFVGNVVEFVYKNSADRMIHVELNNRSAPLVLAVFYLRSGEPRDLFRVSTVAGTPYQGLADGKVFDVIVGTSARTVNKIASIPIDVRISDAP